MAILGTEPIFTKDRITGQRVSQLEYPSRSAENIAQAVANADMGGLYLPNGPLMSHAIYQELYVLKHPEVKLECGADAPDLRGLRAFQVGMVALTHNFQFTHPAAEKLFGGQRQAVTEYHEYVLRQIETGELTDWQELRWQDMDFRDRLKQQ